MYERKRGMSFIMVIEVLLIAFIIGSLKNSLFWGIISFVVAGILYFMPVIGQTLGIISSLVEASIIFYTVTSQQWFNNTEAAFASIIVFLIFIHLHNCTVEMDDNRFAGFGWLLFEVSFSTLFIYYLKKPIYLCVLFFILTLILAVVPYVRVLVLVLLSVYAGYCTYSIFFSLVETRYAIMCGGIIFIYSIAMYFYVYKSFDHRGKAVYKKYSVIQKNIYQRYTELEKVHYYYLMSVCIDEKERTEFEEDWHQYILFLNDNEYVSFNSFFEKERLYAYRFYNRDFARKINNENDLSYKEEQGRDGKKIGPKFLKEGDAAKKYIEKLKHLYTMANGKIK